MEDTKSSTTNGSDGGAKAPVPTKMTHKTLPRIIAGILVIGLVAGAGYMFFLKKEKSPESTAQAPTASEEVLNEKGVTEAINTTCISSTEPKKYTNAKIGVAFCYPKEWGEVTLAKVPASASAKGDAYEINFSAKPGVSVSSATADWKNTITRDPRCSDPSTAPIDFASYAPDWKIEKTGTVTYAASRSHIKNEPRFAISESVKEPLGVCLRASVDIQAGQYKMQSVTFLRQFNTTVSSVSNHIKSPNTLLTQQERTEFNELVASVSAAK